MVRESGAVPNAEYLLEVENVRKAFPGVLALDDVSFRLKRGHVHALMGENGAGKSTLMKIIAGIYQPDSGSFRLKGQEIRLTSPLDALQYGIAMIHQELNLMNFMTVAENIWIRREPLNGFGFVRHEEMRRRTKELFDRLDIGIDPEAEVRDLSVANRQMVEIAKAVSYNSDILIMDEPTSALTEREVAHLFKIIRTLKAQGKGIIYITHKMNELFEIADEVSVFRDGRFVGEHPAAERHARRHHQDDGRSRDHPDVSQADRADRRRRAVGEEPDARGPLSRHFLRSAQGRDSRPRRPRRLGPQQCRRDDVRRDAGDFRHDRHRRREIVMRNPAMAMDAGMAFLTEDRKETGCFLLLDVIANMQIAVLRKQYVRAGFVNEGAIEKLCQKQKARLARAHARSCTSRSSISRAAISRRC